MYVISEPLSNNPMQVEMPLKSINQPIKQTFAVRDIN